MLPHGVVGPKDKQVRIINVIDECSRRALWTEAHFNITARTLITVLNQIVAWRGKPQYIRCDNGSGQVPSLALLPDVIKSN